MARAMMVSLFPRRHMKGFANDNDALIAGESGIDLLKKRYNSASRINDLTGYLTEKAQKVSWYQVRSGLQAYEFLTKVESNPLLSASTLSIGPGGCLHFSDGGHQQYQPALGHRGGLKADSLNMKSVRSSRKPHRDWFSCSKDIPDKQIEKG
ncbi:hypothetical protein EVAR_83088_1 [Eumeta japonica]|uniref:Uncharacterized protein n=1 Tax=Eumeta variegata TaxID=151549 RepID=A0A4C1WPG9_EUMVA|nr:hypothetical protein EVAR_83088_1 [Eumeta japonica]